MRNKHCPPAPLFHFRLSSLIESPHLLIPKACNPNQKHPTMPPRLSPFPSSAPAAPSSLLVWPRGLFVPRPPFPCLALTAHIQFITHGSMVLPAGLLLQSDPFSTKPSTRLVDRLSGWQRHTVYWGYATAWPILLSEVANAWWGTRLTLPLAAETVGAGHR